MSTVSLIVTRITGTTKSISRLTGLDKTILPSQVDRHVAWIRSSEVAANTVTSFPLTLSTLEFRDEYVTSSVTRRLMASENITVETRLAD